MNYFSLLHQRLSVFFNSYGYDFNFFVDDFHTVRLEFFNSPSCLIFLPSGDFSHSFVEQLHDCFPSFLSDKFASLSFDNLTLTIGFDF